MQFVSTAARPLARMPSAPVVGLAEGTTNRGDSSRTQAGNLLATWHQPLLRESVGLAEQLGDEARTPIDYVDVDWSTTRWSGGCYGNFAPPGVYAELGPWLRRPTGAIRWASRETRREGKGYGEGAIRSGERASDEVLELLGHATPTTRLSAV